MECGVHIISKREGKKVREKLLKTFFFQNMVYFLWTIKNGKCGLFFVDGGSIFFGLKLSSLDFGFDAKLH